MSFVAKYAGVAVVAACSAFHTFADAESGNQSNYRADSSHAKTWQGASGSQWIYRTDQLGRLVSFKRLGSKGHEIEMRYDGIGGRPTEARIAGKSWRKVAVTGQNGQFAFKQCDNSSTTSKGPFSVFGAMRATSVGRSAFKRVQLSTDDDDWEDSLWQTYWDITDFYEDQYWSLTFGNPYFPWRTEEEKRQCVALCDSLSDGALIACTVLVEAPIIWSGCVAGVLWMKGKCKEDCNS